MDLEKIKQELEARTGVPGYMLTGNTPDQIFQQARELLALKEQSEAQREKTPRESFVEMFGQSEDLSGEIDSLEETVRIKAGGYPKVEDSGEVANMPDLRPAREKFAEWFNEQIAYNPKISKEL